MMEQYPGGYGGRPHGAEQPNWKQITDATVDINDGPARLSLAGYELTIVRTGRDIPGGWNTDCLIIDPATFNPMDAKPTGFKGLRDGQPVYLGRKFPSRFQYPTTVSRNHAVIFKNGPDITILDSGSTNGTYILPEDTGLGKTDPIDTTIAEQKNKPSDVFVSGHTAASERRPLHNEDAYFANPLIKAVGVFDGVGGQAGSGNASRIAAQSIEQALQKYSSEEMLLPGNIGKATMHEAFEVANARILENGRDDIATTGTVIQLTAEENGEQNAIIGNVGDSRAYLYRDGRLQQLTLDQAYRPINQREKDPWYLQTLLSNVADLSQLNDEQREAFYRRNIIMGALGWQGHELTVGISEIRVRPGDKLFATTDGIHDNLTDIEMQFILATNGAENIPKTLVQAAQNRSRERHIRAKPDDMTVALISL